MLGLGASPFRALQASARRHGRMMHTVQQLNTWDLDNFRHQAFLPAVPTKLPCDVERLPPACSKWFTYQDYDSSDVLPEVYTSNIAQLRDAFWTEHATTMVPLELTIGFSDSSDPTELEFHRSEGPLKILLDHLGEGGSRYYHPLEKSHGIYLAQCDISSLPQAMQNDLPIPEIVQSAGKGDIYSTSFWLGRPPTYTPVHHDPNPNLFWQLAGHKVIRLYPPDIGQAIFDHVQEQLLSRGSGQASSAVFRGAEMMQGPERRLLHDAVWNENPSQIPAELTQHGQDAELGMGEALFIPKGWWHSVKSVGRGVTASANWWFR